MAVDNVLIAFAFSAGAIAFLNPCGFAMLPSYISYFVETTTTTSEAVAAAEESLSTTRAKRRRSIISDLISIRKLTTGALLGLLVTLGFITIFGLTGLTISAIGIGIARIFPWIAVLSGITVIGIGTAKVFGKTFHINIPLPSRPLGLGYTANNRGDINNNTNSNNSLKRIPYAKFFLFGIGYSIASLSCTIPIFLLIVFQGLSAGGIQQGSIVFLSYAFGMGFVMIAVSLALSLSNQAFIKYLKQLTPKMNFITGIVLILAGSYLLYYNLIIGKLLLS